MTEEVIQQLREDYTELVWADGGCCRVCDVYGKVYSWTFYSTMARCLAEIYRLGGPVDWVPMSELREAGLENLTKSAGRLDKWGLTEVAEGKREDGGKHGNRRMTPLGVRFLKGLESVHHKLYLLHNQVILREEPMVTIHDALGEYFDLRKHLGYE